MIGWWAGAAWATSGVQVSGSQLTTPCAGQADCPTTQRIADELRAAGEAGEPVGLAISPSVVRGRGPTLELSGQSVVGFQPPSGVDVVPLIPRIGIGGVSGRRVRVGGGLELGGAVPTGGDDDLGFSADGRFGFSLPSPDEREWIGLEIDGGFGLVEGRLFNSPSIAAVDLGLVGQVPPCTGSCTDVLTLVHGGLDAVIAADVDPTAVVVVRLGGAYQRQALDVAVDHHSNWSWSGLVPRATFGAAYRWGDQGLFGAAVRLGLVEPTGSAPYGRVPWTATLTGGWRFGASSPPSPRLVPTLPVAAPQAAEAAPPPALEVPHVDVVSHPDLECVDGRQPTGKPPPIGDEGWCVTIDPATNRIVRDGPYLKWYDADHIEQRGQYATDQPTGTWVHYAREGQIDTVGDYVDGLPNGTWRTYYPSGEVRTEVEYIAGQMTGESRDWGPDGRTCVVGQWVNGQREGDWFDYVDNRVVRRRTYRGGAMVADQAYVQ